MLALSHSIPTIGSVNIRLEGYPEQLYRLLKRKGEVERLQKLRHLGILGDAFPGMNHTRWDYTLTTLHFISLFADAKFPGLSRTSRIAGISLSGRDILQSLALTSNIGHLPGTFAVEKGVLRCLISLNLMDELLAKAQLRPDTKVDYLIINKIFALIKLHKWLVKANDKESPLLKTASTMASEYFVGNPKTRHGGNIRDLFNLVRRVAYQIVDCLYVNLPIRIDYAEFADQISKFPNLSSHWEPMLGLMDDYTRIVYQQIYHNEKVHSYIGILSDKVCQEIGTENNIITKISEQWLNAFSLENINLTPARSSYRCLLRARLPHKFGPNLINEFILGETVDRVEMTFSRSVPRAHLLILYVPGLRDPISDRSSAGDLSLDVFVPKNTTLGECLRSSALAISWFHKFLQQKWGAGLILKAFLECVMSLATGQEITAVRVEMSPDDFFREDDIGYIVTEDHVRIYRPTQKREFGRLFKRNAEKNWDPAVKEHFHEVRMLKAMVYRRWPKRSISRLTQLIALVPGRICFQKDKKELCEFDGAMLSIEGKRKSIHKMNLFLLEAKSGKNISRNVAKKEIKRKLDRLGGLYKRGRIFNLSHRSAYVLVDLLAE